jgi:hypothetical protein
MMGSVLTDGLFSVRRRTWPAYQILRTELVMPGLAPGIHVFLPADPKTWMAGTGPAMTKVKAYL